MSLQSSFENIGQLIYNYNTTKEKKKKIKKKDKLSNQNQLKIVCVLDQRISLMFFLLTLELKKKKNSWKLTVIHQSSDKLKKQTK